MQLTNCLTVAAVWASVAAAAATPQKQQSKPFKLDFTVLRGDSRSNARKHKRAELVARADAEGSAELELINKQTYYSAKLLIGSNEQENEVLVDTGSSDLWVMAADVRCSASTSYSKRDTEGNVFQDKMRNMDFLEDLAAEANAEKAGSKATRSEKAYMIADKVEQRAEASYITIPAGALPSELASLLGSDYSIMTTVTGGGSGGSGSGSGNSGASVAASACTGFGALSTDSSDSFKLNSSAPAFSISYADGTFADGVWGRDTIDFGGHNVTDFSFAVVNSTDSEFGVLGIGLPGLETTYSSSSRGYMYENFPMKLKRDGIIDKVVYSLYLNTKDASGGSVLFGAVDHAKYSGQLETVPLVNIYSGYYDHPIRLDIALNKIAFESNSQNVTISTSSIAALLDSGTTLTYFPTEILEAYAESLGAKYDSSAGLYQVDCKFNTGSAYAVYTFSGVVIKVPLSDMIITSRSVCYLGVLESTSSSSQFQYAVLGDNFLRNAYIVYNLEDYEISMAQAKYTSDENIEVVSDSIPSAVKAPEYSSTSLASDISGSSSSELSSSGLGRKSGAGRSSVTGSMFVLILGIFAFVAL